MDSKNIKGSIQRKWWKINNNIKENISAKYDRIKDWVINPKGYFLIKVDRDFKQIRVAYCKFSKLEKDSTHNMIAEL